MKSKVLLLVVAATCCCGSTSLAESQPFWTSLLPFRRAENDSDGPYELTDSDGPWLILAASFSGSGAEQQAQELIQELRTRFRLRAYMHRQHYDFTERFAGRSSGGQQTMMRYDKDSEYDAIAVLVGDFPTIDDQDLTKTLKKIKYAQPRCLDLSQREWSTQRFAGLRDLYRRMNGDEEKRKRGPMGNAFATRNPMLPREYFGATDVDDFVIRLNKGVKYSLLKNPGDLTVRVATFRGGETINISEIARLQNAEVSDKLEVAADQAHRLTEALRKQGVEAYEYHDRHESIVTVGSFASESDGGAQQVVKRYEAIRPEIPTAGPDGRLVRSQRYSLGVQPRSLAGVPFDIAPTPMRVPKTKSRGMLGFFR